MCQKGHTEENRDQLGKPSSTIIMKHEKTSSDSIQTESKGKSSNKWDKQMLLIQVMHIQ